MTVQFLPIKEIGQSISDNRFVEEEVIKHIVAKEVPPQPGRDLEKFDFTRHPQTILIVEYSILQLVKHTPPIKEILDPPPNV